MSDQFEDVLGEIHAEMRGVRNEQARYGHSTTRSLPSAILSMIGG